jgi:hypothetical protein
MPDGNMTASPSDKTAILAIILILPPGGRLRPKKKPRQPDAWPDKGE